MNANTTEELVTVDDMCQMLGCGYNTAYDLLKNHEVASFKMGRKWKIPRRGIEEYIRKQAGLSSKSEEEFCS